MNPSRERELRTMLLRRRQEINQGLKNKIHGIRIDGAEISPQRMGKDSTPDIDIQGDIEIALIQLQSDTLGRIDQALGRLDQNLYGHCSECGGEISEKRLRALPFAIRCTECEEAREIAEQREHRCSHRRNLGPLFD